jgi:hypothetical protein
MTPSDAPDLEYTFLPAQLHKHNIEKIVTEDQALGNQTLYYLLTRTNVSKIYMGEVKHVNVPVECISGRCKHHDCAVNRAILVEEEIIGLKQTVVHDQWF